MAKLNLDDIPLAASTRQTYEYALRRWDRWLKTKPEADREATDGNLSAYLSYLFDKEKSASYASNAVAAVRWRCESEDKPDPRGRRTKNAIKNYRRTATNPGRGQIDPLQWDAVDKLAEAAIAEKTIFGVRDAALFLTMSDALLRVSEVCAIDVEHVDFGKNTLYIPRSKTDQEGRGAEQYLSDRTLAHIRAWMEQGKVTDGPLFRPVGRGRLTALKRRWDTTSIRKTIKIRSKQAGIEGRFGGHSFRVGSTQSLTIMGASLPQLQLAGRWTSPNMPAYYSRKVSAQQSAMAQFRYAAK